MLFNSEKREFEQLRSLLGAGPGMVVADVGAGKGEMSIYFAPVVAPEGKIFAVEFDSKRVETIQKKAKKKGLENIVVVTSTERTSNLQAESCDVLVLRKSYHHFSVPHEFNKTLYQALKPGGKLVVIDFAPHFWLSIFSSKNVPKNRKGHGIEKDVLISEVQQAGFVLARDIPKWTHHFNQYCVVFQK